MLGEAKLTPQQNVSRIGHTEILLFFSYGQFLMQICDFLGIPLPSILCLLSINCIGYARCTQRERFPAT